MYVKVVRNSVPFSEIVDFDDVDSSRVAKSSPIPNRVRNLSRRHSWMRTSLRRSPK